MIYSKLLALAVCCGAAYSQSEVRLRHRSVPTSNEGTQGLRISSCYQEVTVYSDVGCKGESLVIKTDNQCTSLSEAWYVLKCAGSEILAYSLNRQGEQNFWRKDSG